MLFRCSATINWNNITRFNFVCKLSNNYTYEEMLFSLNTLIHSINQSNHLDVGPLIKLFYNYNHNETCGVSRFLRRCQSAWIHLDQILFTPVMGSFVVTLLLNVMTIQSWCLNYHFSSLQCYLLSSRMLDILCTRNLFPAIRRSATGHYSDTRKFCWQIASFHRRQVNSGLLYLQALYIVSK